MFTLTLVVLYIFKLRLETLITKYPTEELQCTKLPFP